MNPFDILIPGFFAIVVMVGIGWIVAYRHRPTEAEIQAFTYGYEDGDLGALPLHLSDLKLLEAYSAGYAEGRRGRNRRSDAEQLTARESGPTLPPALEKRPLRPCTCGKHLEA